MTAAAARQTLPQPAIRVRFATVDDVPALVDLFEMFFGESHYKEHVEFSRLRAGNYLERAITSQSSPYIVAVLDHGDERKPSIIGAISYHVDRSFATHPVGVLDELFVVEEFRGTRIGRNLVTLALDQLRNVEHATAMHIPITSGHKNAKTLINLFKKFGAREIGVVLATKL